MTEKLSEIMEQALLLSEDERTILLGRLIESLDSGSYDLDPEWEAEIERRIRDIDSGKAKLIPWEEVRERLKRKFGLAD